MMDEKGDMYSPLTVSDFVAYRLPSRPIREYCNSNGPWGRRSGPRALGSLTQRSWPDESFSHLRHVKCPRVKSPRYWEIRTRWATRRR